MQTPKNTTEGYTEAWKRERQRLTDFYNSLPYYGEESAKRLYDTLKKAIPSIIQVSKCGIIISVTTYKQDADKATHLLSAAFKVSPKQKICPYTDFVTTFIKTV